MLITPTTFKQLLCLGLIIFSGIHLKSQNLSWATTFSGTPLNDIGNACAVDQSGNLYTTGYFSGTVDFDPGPGVFNLTADSSDVFISKLDPLGNFLWAKSFGGVSGDMANAIKLDSQGNVYTTGTFGSTVDFDPGLGVYNLTSSGVTDMFVSKLDASGNFIWAKRIGGQLNIAPQEMVIDGMTNVYITGYFYGTCDFDPGQGVYNVSANGMSDIFMCKLDALGSFIWAEGVGGLADDDAWGITTDMQNNIIITGQFRGAGTDFDPGPGTATLIPNSGSYDIFIAKYTSAGVYQWAKGIGASSPADYGFKVDTDNSGNIYTTGVFGAIVDFDPGMAVYTLSASGYQDGFVCKLDASGNFDWARRLGATGLIFCNGMVVDALGSVYTIGDFTGIMDLDPGVATVNISDYGGLYDIFLSKLDASGNYVWGRGIGGSNTDIATCIAADSFNNLYATGFFSGTTDFDPNQGVFNLTSAGLDIFNFKLCQAPDPPSVSGLQDFCWVPFTTLYSVTNVQSNTSFTWTLPNAWSGISSTSSIAITPGGAGGIFTVTTSNSCGLSSSQVSITVHQPTVDVAASGTLICTGESATLTASGVDTYTWSNGLSTAQISVTPPLTTIYSVVGSDAYNCQDTTAITIQVSPCVGINELKNPGQQISLYPNPAGNKLNILVFGNGELNNASISIYNELGILVSEKKQVSLKDKTMVVETADLPNGMYVLKLNVNNPNNYGETMSKTFMINK